MRFSYRPIGATIGVLALAAWLTAAPVAMAGAAYQQIEWETYSGGKPRFGLYYAGFQHCNPSKPWYNWDHKFVIRLNASYDSDRFKAYSDNSRTRGVFFNKFIAGVNLNSQSPALCLGWRDVQDAGGPSAVASSLYVWLK